MDNIITIGSDRLVLAFGVAEKVALKSFQQDNLFTSCLEHPGLSSSESISPDLVPVTATIQPWTWNGRMMMMIKMVQNLKGTDNPFRRLRPVHIIT